jgi:hypothetical protein
MNAVLNAARSCPRSLPVPISCHAMAYHLFISHRSADGGSPVGDPRRMMHLGRTREPRLSRQAPGTSGPRGQRPLPPPHSRPDLDAPEQRITAALTSHLLARSSLPAGGGGRALTAAMKAAVHEIRKRNQLPPDGKGAAGLLTAAARARYTACALRCACASSAS